MTLVLAALAAAAVGGGADQRFAFATLENGASIGFALVRPGAPDAGDGIGEVVLPRTNEVSRVLWDRESGAYFGYRVEVARQAGPRPFRVEL